MDMTTLLRQLLKWQSQAILPHLVANDSNEDPIPWPDLSL